MLTHGKLTAFSERHSENNPCSGQYLCPTFQCRQPSQQNATSQSSRQSGTVKEGATKHFFLEQINTEGH